MPCPIPCPLAAPVVPTAAHATRPKGRRVLPWGLVTLLALPGAWAETPPLTESAPPVPTDPLGRYRTTAVEIRPVFGSFEMFELRQNGRLRDVGFFGGDAASVFGESAEAMEAMGRYRFRKQLGLGLWATGLSLLLTGLALTLAESDVVVERGLAGEVSELTPAFWGLLLGGTTVGLAGGVILQSAVTPLGEAVDAWNDHAARKAGGLGGPPTIKIGGHF